MEIFEKYFCWTPQADKKDKDCFTPFIETSMKQSPYTTFKDCPLMHITKILTYLLLDSSKPFEGQLACHFLRMKKIKKHDLASTTGMNILIKLSMFDCNLYFIRKTFLSFPYYCHNRLSSVFEHK